MNISRSFKRFFDFLVALVLLVFLFPLLLFIAMWVKLDVGKVFFRQIRPGLNGIPFEMVKFQTMVDSHDSSGRSLPDSERLTKLGIFLRSTSLDELPELWNVLRGHMSLVGPRPLLMEYLTLYDKKQFRRHEVRPGITGWAQVNGRNALSWDERFELDVWYVENQSFKLDMKILLLTVRKVIAREGITSKGEATMSKFKGGRS
ncbi:sugar transferase [Metapseudomonas resinovorans]|uniref:Putative glycosyltransferase n=1 Tax=Metapseudomonas resinovorans NBRC 106553 TaxID=1245471 RepID=S6ATZ3_METRE|nr:sugar transferase [Pseudomonas resinovorans]BAN47716.1 putative glycosyltransferase [Pseudomonas resinovorans NBRC 106553]